MENTVLISPCIHVSTQNFLTVPFAKILISKIALQESNHTIVLNTTEMLWSHKKFSLIAHAIPFTL